MTIKNNLGKQWRLPALWGLLHGINDWVAGYMLATFTLQQPGSNGMLMLVVYAIIGFGGQLPVGMLLDASRSFNSFSRVSLLLLVAAVLAWFINPYAGIVVAGFSSAFVHVTGGAVCLQVTNNKIGPLGLFTAPGVLGLALGTASSSLAAYWLLLPVAVVVAIGFLMLPRHNHSGVFTHPQFSKPLLDGHDWLMMGILLTVTFRSLVYDVIQQVGQNWQYGLLLIGLGAFAGKILGGCIADVIGWKKWVYISLPAAFVTLQFGRENIYMLGFGVACLQSSVPISLLLMRQSMPRFPGVSSAMVLGVGILLAGLPVYLIHHRYLITAWFGAAGIMAAVAVVALVFWSIGKRKRMSLKMSET